MPNTPMTDAELDALQAIADKRHDADVRTLTISDADLIAKAAKSLRARIASAMDAEPVAWRYRYVDGGKWTVQKNRPDWWKDGGPEGYVLEPLYAHPATRDLASGQQVRVRPLAWDDFEGRILAALTPAPVAVTGTPTDDHQEDLVLAEAQQDPDAAYRDEVQCDTCAGNGEIVTDWDEYLHPPGGAPADHAVADCPDCDGSGWTPAPAAKGTEAVPVAWTGNGSLMALADGREGFMWPAKADAHPLPLYTHPAAPAPGIAQSITALEALPTTRRKTIGACLARLSPPLAHWIAAMTDATPEAVERLAAHYDERVRMHDDLAGDLAHIRRGRGRETRDFHEQTASALRALQQQITELTAENYRLTRISATNGEMADIWARKLDAAEAERDNAVAQAGAAAADMRERAAETLDTHGDGIVNEALSQQLCCGGQMCGCMGADVGVFLQHLIRALPLNPDAEVALKRVRKEAFVAGFMSTSEGCNGEYVRSGDCEAVARDCADSWISRTDAPK